MSNKKKKLVILLLLIVSIFVISSVSAADNGTDNVASYDADISDVSSDSNNEVYKVNVADKVSSDEHDELSASVNDDSVVSKDESADVLSGFPVSSYQYTVQIQDGNQISETDGGNLYYYLKPYNMVYMNNYYFNFVVYDVNGKICYTSGYIYSDAGTTPEGLKYIVLGKNILKPGVYVITAVNKADGNVMSANALRVSGTAVITANDFNGVYNTGTMTARVTDSKQNPLTSMNVKVDFTQGANTITKTYYSDSNGYVSFTPPVDAGVWSVTFSSGLSYVTATPVTITAAITKAPISIKTYKVTEYKGFKTTLKARVTSNGQDVNGGTVTFRINGKTYKAAVVNGWAIKKVKLTKLKTYKFTAKFNGNNNIKASKKVKSKAVLKKRFGTKIICKNYALYTFKEKTVTIKVKTTTGKNVKGGKLKITGAGLTHYVAVKNGKAKVVVKGLHAMKHFIGFKKGGETYKKSITQKHKIKYIPASHKYKSSSKRMKVTSKFRCPLCGKTKTHPHYVRGYYYTYRGSLIRIV